MERDGFGKGSCTICGGPHSASDCPEVKDKLKPPPQSEDESSDPLVDLGRLGRRLKEERERRRKIKENESEQSPQPLEGSEKPKISLQRKKGNQSEAPVSPAKAPEPPLPTKEVVIAPPGVETAGAEAPSVPPLRRVEVSSEEEAEPVPHWEAVSGRMVIDQGGNVSFYNEESSAGGTERIEFNELFADDLGSRLRSYFAREFSKKVEDLVYIDHFTDKEGVKKAIVVMGTPGNKSVQGNEILIQGGVFDAKDWQDLLGKAFEKNFSDSTTGYFLEKPNLIARDVLMYLGLLGSDNPEHTSSVPSVPTVFSRANSEDGVLFSDAKSFAQTLISIFQKAASGKMTNYLQEVEYAEARFPKRVEPVLPRREPPKTVSSGITEGRVVETTAEVEPTESLPWDRIIGAFISAADGPFEVYDVNPDDREYVGVDASRVVNLEYLLKGKIGQSLWDEMSRSLRLREKFIALIHCNDRRYDVVLQFSHTFQSREHFPGIRRVSTSFGLCRGGKFERQEWKDTLEKAVQCSRLMDATGQQSLFMEILKHMNSGGGSGPAIHFIKDYNLDWRADSDRKPFDLFEKWRGIVMDLAKKYEQVLSTREGSDQRLEAEKKLKAELNASWWAQVQIRNERMAPSDDERTELDTGKKKAGSKPPSWLSQLFKKKE